MTVTVVHIVKGAVRNPTYERSTCQIEGKKLRQSIKRPRQSAITMPSNLPMTAVAIASLMGGANALVLTTPMRVTHSRVTAPR